MKKVEKYFYGKEEAALYDSTINSVVPQYSIMVQVMHDFARQLFLRNDSLYIQDIGSGTGVDSIPMLQYFKNATLQAWDLEKEMKSKFEFNANHQHIGKQRFEYDILDYRESSIRENFYNLTISGYCIHHYDLSIKAKFFENIFRNTKQGGYFILKDLVNYKSPRINQYCHNFDLHFIENSFQDLAAHRSPEESKVLKALCNSWIYHMNNDNILDTAEAQMEIMKDIGFQEVECIYKYLQHALIIARK